MSDRGKTEYLRPDSALPRYLMMPRFLLEAELPDGARLLYALLLDRARLSMQNPGWTDERGRVFLIYTIRDLSAAMRRSESAVKVALRARGRGADPPRAAGARQGEPAVSFDPG